MGTGGVGGREHDSVQELAVRLGRRARIAGKVSCGWEGIGTGTRGMVGSLDTVVLEWGGHRVWISESLGLVSVFPSWAQSSCGSQR